MRQCLPNETHQFIPKKLNLFEYYECIICHKYFSREEVKAYARKKDECNLEGECHCFRKEEKNVEEIVE